MRLTIPSKTERGIIPVSPTEHEQPPALRAATTMATKDPARSNDPKPDFAPADLALPSWQAAVKDAVRDPAELLRLLELPADALPAPARTAFPLLVPRSFVARMRKGDASDPLLKQVWPHAAELEPAQGFSADPVREQGLAAQGVI